jgi:hypothetical protein
MRPERAAHVRKQEVQRIEGGRVEAAGGAALVSVYPRRTNASSARRSAGGITGRASFPSVGITP